MKKLMMMLAAGALVGTLSACGDDRPAQPQVSDDNSAKPLNMMSDTQNTEQMNPSNDKMMDKPVKEETNQPDKNKMKMPVQEQMDMSNQEKMKSMDDVQTQDMNAGDEQKNMGIQTDQQQ